MKNCRVLIIFISLFTFLFTLPSTLNHSFAQSFDIASIYQINDEEATTGDIVSSVTGKGLVRSDVAYDNNIFGVIQDTPVIVFKEVEEDTGKSIVRQGDAVVKVTNYNGDIEPGVQITTSPIKGFGMKATQSGYVVGVVTSEFRPAGKTTHEGKEYDTGIVNIAMKIEFAEISEPRNVSRSLSYLNAAIFRNVQDPEKFFNFLKYITAVVIGVSSFAIGFFTFSRAIPKGIEAIGRNPLAKGAIEFSIILNLILTIVTVSVGLIISILVLRL